MSDGRELTTDLMADDLSVLNVGDYLRSINGVGFAAPLSIEGIDAHFMAYDDGEFDYVLVTVWFGPAMVGMILNRDDHVQLISG